jgi:signal transduction histidine kinase
VSGLGGSASLSARLTIAALIWFSVMLAAGGAALSLAFESAAFDQFAEGLEATSLALLSDVGIGADGRPVVARPLSDPRFERVRSGWAWQLRSEDGTLLRSRSLWDSELRDGSDGLSSELGADGMRLVAFRRTAFPFDSSFPIRMTVTGPASEIEARTRRFDGLLVAALLSFAVCLFAFALVQARFGLLPVRALARRVEALSSGSATRLGELWPSETLPLAKAIDGLLDRDERLVSAERTRATDLAHALRTPLAVLRAKAEAGISGDELLDGIDALSRVANARLGLMSSSAATTARCDASSIVRSSASAFARATVRTGVSVSASAEDGLVFFGASDDLEEMLGELLDGACSRAESIVVIRASADGDGLSIAIEDDGVAPVSDGSPRGSSRLDVGRRDFRPALVSELSARYGGSLRVEMSEHGGTRVELRLVPPAPGFSV